MNNKKQNYKKKNIMNNGRSPQNIGRSVVSPVTLVSSTNKTDCQDIAEILLKVALNTITLTLTLKPLNTKKD